MKIQITEFEELKARSLRNIELSQKALEEADDFLQKVTENVENFWLLDNKHVSEIDF